ncbi:hypothetical protein AVEN_145366-1 [Araneus ventricosus]|uniref:Uncharacterized protein n=1 Tax=Araneus ventricosus TaxID=182803 RepID=A0A4Y2JFI2_ARAVE|nr:hypothetical protein AVEN_145366-1 [Araneus ventricosus]
MMRTTSELASPLQGSAPHGRQGVWLPHIIWRAAGPMQGGSAVELGFEPGAFHLQGRHLATKPPAALLILLNVSNWQ